MFAAFSAEIEVVELYRRFYQPAKHPGDAQRATRSSYLTDVDHLDKFFGFRWWLDRYATPPRELATDELFSDFKWWLDHCDRPPMKVRICDCSDELVVASMNWLIELGRERTTANRLRRHINAIWRWGARQLAKWGTIIARPDNDKYAENISEPIAFLPDELERILAACARRQGMVGSIRASDWWLAAVLFIFSAGIRIGVACKTPTSKLDLARGDVLVPAGGQKNRHEQRLDLHSSAISALKLLRLTERGVPTILGDWPFTVNTLRRHFAQILVDAGIFPSVDDVPRELKFHALRKTLGSQIIAKAGLHVACARLGHSTVEVTKRYRDRRYGSEHRIAELVKDPLPSPPDSRPPLRIADVG